MKRRFNMMMVVVGLAAAVVSAGETKIAVVNGSRALKEYYKTELADTHIQQQLDDFAAERDKLLAEHRKLKQEFEALRAEAQNKALTDEARDKKREQAEGKLTDLIEYEGSIREKADLRKKQIEGEGRKMHAELSKAVRSAVQTCANTGGFSLVLESGGMLANGLEPVLYADPAMDITDQVIKLLNAGKPESKE